MIGLLLTLALVQSCTMPDPFVSIGGGVCVNGGWQLPIAAPAPIVTTPVVSFPDLVDDADNNEGRMVISPPCDGRPHSATWRNDFGVDIYIEQIAIWQGVSRWAVVDYVSQVFINWNDLKQKTIWSHSWDHYGPTTWHAPFERTYQTPFVVPPHGWITFNVQCSSLVGPVTELQGAQLHVFFVTKQ